MALTKWRGKPVILTPHAQEALKRRGISVDALIDAIDNPDETYYNTKTDRFILVKMLNDRGIIVVLDEFEDR